jgi:TolB-like protein/DNA-binding winged helix-turn-helix (wHTH) protein
MMSSSAYRFGDWVVEPQLNRVHRGDVNKRLEPRSMDVLRYLLEHAGETVSVDQLLDTVWAGRVVEPTAVHRGIKHIRQALGDDSRQPRYVETISKRGYRAIAAVQCMIDAEIQHAGSAPEQPVANSMTNPQGLSAHTPRIPMTGELEGQAGEAEDASPVDIRAPLPLLAVLPFDNISADPELQYISDGVSEEILQAVARSVGVRVVGRSSSFQLRGPDKAAWKVAETLKATHVLDGSIRRSGQRLRISTQLIDCASQSMLWSQRFERELSDFFLIQDEIARRVALALSVTFVPAVPMTALDPVAFDLYLRARTGAPTYVGAYDIDLLQAAVDRDPGLAPAWAALALSLAIVAQDVAGTLSAVKVEAMRTRARQAAEQALELDRGAGLAHAALAALEPLAGAFDRAYAHLSRAMAVMPDEPAVLMRMQRWCWSVGRFAEGHRFITQAFELDPLNPAVANDHATMLVEGGRILEANAVFDANRERWLSTPYVVVNPLFTAAYLGDGRRVDALLADIRARGPHVPFVTERLPRVLRMRRSREEAGRADLDNMRRTLSETGTVSLIAAGQACVMGFTGGAYDLMERASFAHLFEPGGRLLAGDGGVHWLFGPSGCSVSSHTAWFDSARFGRRFVRLCGRFGLCDYWLESGNWPDCAESLSQHWDFEVEMRTARRVVSQDST